MATPVVMENDGNLESHTEKEMVAKPKRIIVKEVPPAHKKIGHLKVDKDGEMLYKKTPSSTLMQSLQLGIQQVVGSLEPKPKRDLLMTDFEVVEVTDFPNGGSEFTPAHRHKDFRFKDYSPVAFRFFREAFQIKPEDYMVSLCHNPMTELSNPGASGSLFYRSADDEFIMKTVSKKEAEFLQKLLPGYYLNLTQNKRTLLPKFFGLYNYQSGGKNIRITVMNNLLPSTIEYHEKYDLKGSTYKRYASPEECAKAHPTYKDVDFVNRHPEGIILAADVYDQLMSTVKRDVMVLKSFGIMDYSLLMGIHNIDEELRRPRDQASSTSPMVDGTATLPLTSRQQQLSTTTESPLQRSLTVRRLFSIIPESATAQTPNLSVEEPTSTPYEVPPGGVMGKTEKGERVLIFLGIIDILQSYKLRKKLEHTLKSVIIDGDTVSVHKPGFYMKRFYDHVSTKVFKKEVKEKAKPKTRRSISGRPPGMRRQASLGSEDAANIKPHVPRQSVSSPERDDTTKNQCSPPLLNDPPPVYTERPHKSPEHLLVPRLSSVEEFHEPSLSPTANSDEMTTHELDQTPTTMVTTEEETVTNSEGTSEPTSFTVTVSKEKSEHVTVTNISKVDVAMTTGEPYSEETDEHVTMTSSEGTSGHVTMTTSSEATNAPITVTANLDDTVAMTTSSEADITMTTNQPQERNTNSSNTAVTEATPTSNAMIMTTTSEADITMTTNQPQENKNTDSNTAVTEATPTSNGNVEIVDPSEINILVTINDSV